MASAPLQLDLFADHVALLNRGRVALAEFDLDAALENFVAVLAMVPSHADARAACERTRTIRALLDERAGPNGSVANALLEIADAIEPALRPGLYRRVARE